MTDEEALKRVCPLSMNQDGGPCCCVGRWCMAWRWSGVLSNGRRIYGPEAARAANNPDLPSDQGGMNDGDTPLGYCGLAGKP